MKELIVILGIAGGAFWLARPVALLFSAPADFSRRRNTWFALTITAFLSPSFWVFTLFAVPIYIWLGRKDSNPIAAYMLLLHVVPPISAAIPYFGAGQLFALDNYRLLSFCILIPIAVRAHRSDNHRDITGSRVIDLLFLAYSVLQCVLYAPPNLHNNIILQDSPTNFLRRTFLIFIDIFVLYYAVSRSCNDKRKIVDAAATFCLSSGIMALIAIFEHLKGWLLYTQLAAGWDPINGNYVMAWLLRGDSWLRTQASSGHALALGFMMAIAFGFWLYLQSRATSLRVRVSIGVLYCLGMIAAFSRGSWIGALLIYVTYAALKPRAVSRIFKAGFIFTLLLGLMSLSPQGQKLIDSLPFFSSQTDATFLYRQQLLELSLDLIKAHPFFGDQLAAQKMESLRQGQGIIDIVNTYLGVALFSGWIGLSLFVGFILAAATGVFRHAKAIASEDPERALLGFNLVACIVGAAFIIADCSLIMGVEKTFYILIALAAAYVRLGNQMASTITSSEPSQRTGRALHDRMARGNRMQSD